MLVQAWCGGMETYMVEWKLFDEVPHSLAVFARNLEVGCASHKCGRTHDLMEAQ